MMVNLRKDTGIESAKNIMQGLDAINNFGTVYSEEEITISTKKREAEYYNIPHHP